MAKKSDSDFSKSRNMRDLDEALNRSFTNIKNDMTALREGQHQHGIKLAEMKQNVKDTKSDFVTLDKFNILKIKIGELNENMKKVWDIEKKLEDVDRKSVSSSEFDKHSVAVDNEIAKLKEDLSDLDKTAATEEQTKKLVGDINSEFDKVKQAIEELRLIKDSITRAELDKRTKALDKRADDVREDFDKVKAKVKTKVDTAQVESLVSDINSEFDRLKEKMGDIREGENRFALSKDVDKQLEKVNKKMENLSDAMTTAVDEFSKGVEVTFKDFAKRNEKRHDALSRETDKVEKKLNTKMDNLKDSVSDKLSDMKSDMKTLVTKKQTETLVKDINKEFDAVKEDVDDNTKQLTMLRKDSATRKELSSEVLKLKKGIEHLSKDLVELRKDAAMEDDTSSRFKDLKEMITDTNKAIKQKFNELLGRIKKESTDNAKSIKENSQDINTVEKTVRKDMKAFVSDDDLHDELDVIKDEFERLHKEMKSMQDSMVEDSELNDVNKRLKRHVTDTKKEFVSKKQFKRLVSAVEKLGDEVDDQSVMIREKDKQLRAYAKELKAAKRASKKLARYESVVAKSDKKAKKAAKKAGKKGKQPAKPFAKSRFLANFLIGAAFLLLIIAVTFFFNGLTGLTDVLAVAAVICFVLGIVIRIVVGFKGNGA
jgi:chromosome segregation ATPase